MLEKELTELAINVLFLVHSPVVFLFYVKSEHADDRNMNSGWSHLAKNCA